jgi:hypothetical protein
MKRAFELINDETSDCRDLLSNSRLAMIVDLDSAGPDTLSKLSRYEARLERSFYKALSELRRTQSQREPAEPRAAKQTQSDEQPPDPVPPPVASDPAPSPRSENQHPTTNIQHASSEPPTAKHATTIHSAAASSMSPSPTATIYTARSTNCGPRHPPPKLRFGGAGNLACCRLFRRRRGAG